MTTGQLKWSLGWHPGPLKCYGIYDINYKDRTST